MIRRPSRAASWGVLVVIAVSALAATQRAAATSSPEEELARRYAPIIAVQAHTAECGTGEPYAPATVESVLGQDGVVLRGADGTVLVERPTAADLIAAPADSHIDMPGNALDPGCSYERWFQQTSAGATPTVYARVAPDSDEPGRLALQYWVFWVYNDWNDRHEGDWEMLQIAFDANTAADALQRSPVEVAVAQHEGSERRPWDRVQRQGDHPVVFPGTGSHATYFTADRWFGKSAASGFGCDDTRAPSTLLEPAVVMLPAQTTGLFAWLQYQGHWGEQQPSFNNGPTGPITKAQWAHPITWMEEEGRTSSVSLPVAGTKVTDFFCTASSKGSLLFIRFLDQPWLVLATTVLLVGLIAWGVRRTLWSPDQPLPLATVRHNGQILRGAARLVWEQRRRFAPIGLLVLVGGLLAAIVQALVLRIPAVDAMGDIIGKDNNLSVGIALAAGALVSLPIAVVAITASLTLADDLDTGSDGGHVIRRTIGSRALRTSVPVAVLVVVGALVPIVAAVLLVLYCLAPRVAQVQQAGVKEAFRGARVLTKGHRLKVLLVMFTAVAVAALTGPFVGTIVLLITSASFALVNVIAALFAAFMLPWVAVVLALLHGDLTAEDHRP